MKVKLALQGFQTMHSTSRELLKACHLAPLLLATYNPSNFKTIPRIEIKTKLWSESVVRKNGSVRRYYNFKGFSIQENKRSSFSKVKQA